MEKWQLRHRNEAIIANSAPENNGHFIQCYNVCSVLMLEVSQTLRKGIQRNLQTDKLGQNNGSGERNFKLFPNAEARKVAASFPPLYLVEETWAKNE